MSKIKSGNYTLNIDRYCMWITTQVVSEKSKKKRNERITGYHMNLGALLEDFIRKAEADDCRTMKAAIERLKKAEEEALQIAKDYEKYRVGELE